MVFTVAVVLLAVGALSAAAARELPVPPAVCHEHGVLEAVCTKCNPALVPVFQAKGDWCAEHGFPESFCPVCHPDRAGRPDSDVSAEDAPADGTTVRFKSKDTARMVGIETAPARRPPDRVTLEAPATVVFDATRIAEVNARAAGVVREIHVDVGTIVPADASLAIIESADVGAGQSRRAAAAGRVAVAEANHRRLTALRREGIAPEREVLAARQELEAAQADLAATRAALGMVGPDQNGAAEYAVRAPIAGVVTQRMATIGQLVGAEEVLFQVVDTSIMWAQVDVPEAHLGAIAAGQPVVIAVEVLGARQFSGTIDYVAPIIDPQTRTVTARVRLNNPDGVLRANMIGQATITVGADASGVLVPAAAVQRVREAQIVFVRVADDAFEARRVRLLSSADGAVAISGRVRVGDPVVTVGGFLLKTETLKGSIGAGCCEGE